ncbi:helix-turn-helix domain-containing protein [Chryseobacterium camelliae]|uniref:Helix-turn-helix domain-containing protein n=1 Tax=Chryseobacterium camelliae TaxID=1265445 RepID=A0ABY7QNL3_9FLAO|nr:helix-turn-helix domain-containing protein [Chryseobacterium camelliae]WBV61245.1 helix-turn-helix domain-containing protein [Chryseobacterium camelliae]
MKIEFLMGKRNDIFYSELHSETEFKQQNTRFFSIILIEEGKGKYRLNDIEYDINPYQMHLVFPGQNYKWDIEESQKTKIYQMKISEKIFEIFRCYLMLPFSFYEENSVYSLAPSTFYKFLNEFNNINNEVSKNIGFWKTIYSRIRVLVLMVGKEACKTFTAKYDLGSPSSHLIQFLILVIKYFKEERTVKFYADKLSISPNYLNILCKKYFGKNAVSIITDEVVLELCCCLTVSVKPIKEIVYDFNFTDLSTFSTFFKKNTGMTPREFVHEYKKAILMLVIFMN